MNDNFDRDPRYNAPNPFRFIKIIVALIFVVVSLVVGLYLPNMKDSSKSDIFKLMTSKEFNHPVTLTGKENVKIDANGSFELVTKEEDLREFYDFEGLDYETILLAAANSDTRMTIEKSDVKEYLDYINEELEGVKETPPEEKETKLQELRDNGYNDVEMEFIEKIMKGETLTEEEMKYFSQEFISQEFLYSYYSHNPDFNYIGKEDYQINGEKVQVSEFMYPDDNGKNIRFYEANALKGEDIYILTIWAYEKEFLQNKDAYQRYIKSFEY